MLPRKETPRERHGGRIEIAICERRNQNVRRAGGIHEGRGSFAYREMLLIRRFEEKAGQMYGMGLIGGFCHLYIGQEAVVVGVAMAAKDGDQDHHLLPRPWPHAGLRHGPQGRHGRTDRTPRRPIQGKGGSMHMFSSEKNFFGGTASSARRWRSAPAWPSPTGIADKKRLA